MKQFRLLVVEDNDETLEDLVSMFRSELTDAHVDAASTVTDALRLIDLARSVRASYDLAVLDFKLPQSEGMSPEVDLNVCEAFLNFSPGAPVAHITGYPDDTEILKHINVVHAPHTPRGFIIDKASSKWATELLRRTQECLYGALVESEYDELFGQPSGQPRLRSLGARAAELCSDVSTSWKYLDHRLRDKLRLRLMIDDERSSPVRVDLK